MSPLARREFPRSIFVTHRLNVDERVMWCVAVLATLLCGIFFGQYAEKKARPEQKCDLSLPDGRRLQTHHLDEYGRQFKCVYESRTWGKK